MNTADDNDRLDRLYDFITGAEEPGSARRSPADEGEERSATPQWAIQVHRDIGFIDPS